MPLISALGFFCYITSKAACIYILYSNAGKAFLAEILSIVIHNYSAFKSSRALVRICVFHNSFVLFTNNLYVYLKSLTALTPRICPLLKSISTGPHTANLLY